MKIIETEAKYPGDSILTLRLRRGNELGSVRVQDYGQVTSERYEVGGFLPGEADCMPGDTPKVWPEQSEWTNDHSLAYCYLYLFAGRALLDGWELTP